MYHLNIPKSRSPTHQLKDFPAASRPHSAASSVFDLPSTNVGLQSNHQTLATTPIRFSSTDSLTLEREAASYMVISGGTGCNGIVGAFGSRVTYVLPVSDNGGSSSEIIRVLGGPSIGDIRSRLIRLIPVSPPNSPTEAIRRLLGYRFPSHLSEHEAREEWRDIIQGRSKLWQGIPADRKETIRGFLVYFESELLRRAQKKFSFRNGSVGNYFLTACHLFFRSVPSAIFLFSSITGSQARILPVLVTNHTVTIAAELVNGTQITGQCEISHPVKTEVPSIQRQFTEDDSPADDQNEDEDDDDPDGPTNQGQNMMFAKGQEDEEPQLPSPIQRVFYINQYGQEIFPSPNQEFVRGLNTLDVLVYSIGSLWTSIIPCLALRGIASAIARSSSLRAKVLLLNGCNDRETDGYTAVNYIDSITRTLNQHYRPPASSSSNPTQAKLHPQYPTSAFITHLVYLENTTIHVDVSAITELGVKCIAVRVREFAQNSSESRKGTSLRYNSSEVQDALERILDDVAYPTTPS